MAQNNGTKKKKSNLYYAVIALLLIISGALGTSQQDGNVADNNADVVIESQIDENETKEEGMSDKKDSNDSVNVNSEETVNIEEIVNTEEVNADTEQNNVSEESRDEVEEDTVEIIYTFRKKSNLESHYEKHGIEMGFENAEEYLAAANKVLTNPDTLHKIEAEDGDDVYYLEETNEFVVVSTDGYIRTYFNPSGGIDYFNRQ